MSDRPDDGDDTVRVGRRSRDDGDDTVRVARPVRRGDLADDATTPVARVPQQTPLGPPVTGRAEPPTEPSAEPSDSARSPFVRDITPLAPDHGVISRGQGDGGESADAAATAPRSRDVDGAAVEQSLRRIARVRVLTVLGAAIAVVAASVVLLVLLLA